MYALTAQQMKALDKCAIDDYQIPAILLMERAALAIYDEIKSHYTVTDKILVVCGAGNNGGDGLALTRLLINGGYRCTVFMLGKAAKLSQLAQLHYQILERLEADIRLIESEADLVADDYQLAIDAIFGVSLNRPVSGIYSAAIDWLNQLACPVWAVDVPSGCAASSGKCLPIAVKAAKTISLAAPKIGLYLYPAADCVGQLMVADIGIPKAAYRQLAASEGSKLIDVLTDDCLSALAERSANSHKGSYGHALVVAGSQNMAGAALLAAKAAYTAGAGVVSILSDDANQAAINCYLPEAICHGYRRSAGDLASKQLKAQADKASALLVGPGLAVDDCAATLLRSALAADLALVIDADGLNLLARDSKLLQGLKSRQAATILTPHIGEMARLTHLTSRQILDDPVNIARQFAERHQVILVLKSARTIVAQPNGKVAINIRGNSGMATAGSGDVLAGCLVGLLANRANAADTAANAAVYLHATAGDKAALKTGESALIASDIIEQLKGTAQGLFQSHNHV